MKNNFFACLINSVLITFSISLVGYQYVDTEFKRLAFHQEETYKTKLIVADKIKKMSELITADQKVSVTIPVEFTNKIAGQQVGKTSYIYEAIGTISAGIDLQQININNIIVEQDRIKVMLPSSSVLKRSLDVNQSKILAYNKAWFAPDVSPEKQQEIEKLALKQIENQALAQDLLVQANQNAQQVVQALLNKTSTKKIIVVIS